MGMRMIVIARSIKFKSRLWVITHKEIHNRECVNKVLEALFTEEVVIVRQTCDERLTEVLISQEIREAGLGFESCELLKDYGYTTTLHVMTR